MGQKPSGKRDTLCLLVCSGPFYINLCSLAKHKISRTTWQGDEDSIKKIKNATGKVNGEGYVNVAAELGLSGARDYSTYHQQWVRQQGYGYY